jgi:hypothetical protein
MKKGYMTALLILIVLFGVFSGCQERPATPFPTANPTQNSIIQELYKNAHNPWKANTLIEGFKEKTQEDKKLILTNYVDGYLQQSGFGLGRVRMELLKGLISFNYYSVDPVSIMEVSRELPSDGDTGFAFLPPRTIIVIAGELHSIWEETNQSEYLSRVSELFLDMGVDSNWVGAYLRALEVRNYFVRLTAPEAELPMGSQTEYKAPQLGVLLKYPQNWEASDQEDQLIILHPDTTAVVSVFKLSEDTSADELMNVLQQDIQQSNPGMSFEESPYLAFFEASDQKSSLAFDYQLDYPLDENNFLAVSIMVLDRDGQEYVLIVGQESIEAEVNDMVVSILKSIQFVGN